MVAVAVKPACCAVWIRPLSNFAVAVALLLPAAVATAWITNELPLVIVEAPPDGPCVAPVANVALFVKAGVAVAVTLAWNAGGVVNVPGVNVWGGGAAWAAVAIDTPSAMTDAPASSARLLRDFI